MYTLLKTLNRFFSCLVGRRCDSFIRSIALTYDDVHQDCDEKRWLEKCRVWYFFLIHRCFHVYVEHGCGCGNRGCTHGITEIVVHMYYVLSFFIRSIVEKGFVMNDRNLLCFGVWISNIRERRRWWECCFCVSSGGIFQWCRHRECLCVLQW